MPQTEHALYIKEEHLSTYAENCAQRGKHSADGRPRVAVNDLRQALRDMARVHDAAHLRWQGLAAMPGAVRWLLDNHYLALREGAEALATLRAAGPVRQLEEGELLMSLARQLLRSGRWELTEERLALFLQGYQRHTVLTGSELALLPAALRAAAIAQLALHCRDAEQSGEWKGREEAFARLFTTLRFLSTRDLGELLERADFVERCYQSDPAGVYPLMDDDSRAHYRQLTARLARRRGISEYKAARLVLSLAKHGKEEQSHVGYWLLREPLGSRGRPRQGGVYMAAHLLLTLFLSLLCAFVTGSVPAFFLLVLPLSELSKHVMDLLLSHVRPAAQLPRLALEEGLPPEGRTLCVVSCLLTGAQDGPVLARRLEEYRMGARDCGEELLFALLADLPDTTEEHVPEAEDWLRAAGDAIEALNRRYGGGFFLLTRPRVKTGEGRWMGWERKRGALWETMRLLRQEDSSVRCAAGEERALQNVHYLLALDSDTRLPPEAARELLGAALHPLNRPRLDKSGRRVVAGHGILSPRLSTSLSSATASDFARIFSPPGGTEPYSGVAGEIYMDNWASGGFAGKGLIHIDSCLRCLAGRIPEGRVLSHDALEGAFLRAGYDSRVELLDDFPATPLSYFKRQHRWIRGDWQNAPWLFARGRELPPIERYRLLDSLRRSLLPVMELAAMAAYLLWPSAGMLAAALLALAAVAFPLLLQACQSLFRPEEEPCRRFHSSVITGLGGSLLQTLLHLVLLPMEAWFALDAVVRALWRMLVSHKKLLQWQTAGQSDAVKNGPLRLVAAAWPVCVLGLGLLVFGSILGRAAGVLWLLSPLCAYVLGVRRGDNNSVSLAQAQYLMDCAREIWRFFEDFLTPEDHFLPPDNYQARPALGLAHRTSPTNIGLALLSALSARELELVEDARFADLTGKMLDTLERLEKWHGHLYNWYDTRTLQPLTPRYVSTVDSGNFCACLTAMATGLRSHGHEDLARRVDVLLRPVSFRPLYDEQRGLFHIGLDPARDKRSESYYDLLSSEARLTAYFAIARGDVPRRHWRRLSRAQLQKNGYRGMASWTGTMFEYLMPELLLPLYRDSLLYETARFCLYVQRRRHRPWGTSESAYYSLDPAMSYRYKAHGCAGLALKPGMDEELVLSPYSSFLTLPLDVGGAVENLKRLESLGLRGEYGFWEALDLSCGRQGGVVKNVMAHHLGMSLCAIANALCERALVSHFMSDAAMGGYALLLQEKLPLGGVVMKRKNLPVPNRPKPQVAQEEAPWREGVDLYRPDATALASQVYSLVVTESGLFRPLWGKICPYIPPEQPLDRCRGMELLLRVGGEEVSLLPTLEKEENTLRQHRFSPALAQLQSQLTLTGGRLTSHTAVCLPREEAGEQYAVTLQWQGEEQEAELVLRFAPLLAREQDYRSHPAFAKLGLCAQVRQERLLVRRLPKGEQGALYLAAGADRPCRFDHVPGVTDGRGVQRRALKDAPYFFTEPLVECRVALTLRQEEGCRCTFALGLGHSEQGALAALEHTLGLTAEERGDLPERAAAVLGLEKESRELTRRLLPRLLFPGAPLPGPQRREELWKFGISGDRPILCAHYREERQLTAARQLLDSHLLLCGCGVDFDLVFISHDDAGYQKPLNTLLHDLLWRSGGDLLSGVEGGVHIVAESDGVAGLASCAAVTVELDGLDMPVFRDTERRPVALRQQRAQQVPQYRFEQGEFCFGGTAALPKRSWSHVLSNGRFGFLATDCGSGNCWQFNARENALSPWNNAPLATQGPERLYLQSGERRVSLFAAADGERWAVRYAPGVATWEKQWGRTRLRTRAFIPPDTDARVLLIELENAPEGAVLHWQMDLQMAPQRADSRYVRTAERDWVLVAQNERATASAKPLLAMTQPAFLAFTCDADAARREDYDGHTGCHARSAFAVKLPGREKMVIVCGGDSPDKLRQLADVERAEAALEATRAFWRRALPLHVVSPSPALDRLSNGWLGYQALCCRMMGRCSVYQSGGAYGFRDQLQDAVNLMLLDPSPAREQILRCCARQYREGDVQHWWHEGGHDVRGVRTRCSDDLLWLPWALCEYVEKSGDESILRQTRPWLVSPELAPHERDRYEAAEVSLEEESVLTHACRSMDLVLRRGTGAHGLLGMGSGDWNDGFDRVGGESQWLTWFFIHTAERFAVLPGLSGEQAAGYRAAAAELRTAAEQAWDGGWYRRGYFADGTPLGSRESPCCRIDSIAQSFAALCPGTDPERVNAALSAAVSALYDKKHGLVRLFTPPFDGRGPDPGYIAAYGPGFRENGGQYTHAAVWLVMALLRQERREEAWELLQAILPGEKDPARYQAEPYVIAADVYTAPGHEGEAGWTWYTGSAGWLLRVILEELLGLKMVGGTLRIEPRLPKDWKGCRVTLRGHEIVMDDERITVDGQAYDGQGLALK